MQKGNSQKMVSAKWLAGFVSGYFRGPDDLCLSGVATLQDANPTEISFLTSNKYKPLVQKTKAGCILLSKEMSASFPGPKIIVDVPYLALARVMEIFYAKEKKNSVISPLACIDKEAQVGKDVSIGPYCTIEKGAVIGDGSIVMAQSYIGEYVKIGKECLIYPNVNILERSIIKDRVIIHAGCAIGSDGFGYAFDSKVHIKIPQIGIVEIGSDVEIGASVAIDRAFLGKTSIGDGTKIDNLVQIGHNVEIGKHCIIVSQVGISGSVKIGNYVTFAGKVGIAGHLNIEDGVTVGAGSGVHSDLKAGKTYWGFPASEYNHAILCHGAIQRLPELRKLCLELRKRIVNLEKELKTHGS